MKLSTNNNSAGAPNPPISILQDILLQASQQPRSVATTSEPRPPTPVISLADSDIEDEFGPLFENITPPTEAAAVVQRPPQQFGGKDLNMLRREETNAAQAPLKKLQGCKK
ncbi:uncharacterized protein LOC116182693 [Photinus pyralis]|uniref:uncharacterized protein LOC116160307 n=1 Tax=Photinus pyralis TaxID=7054 RepID=UPI001266E78F|nr:uncharacterized protein LOC116160307 [Photinus pyralis]XP_031359098.1 uncharacterized protein LOC116182693 [Photinus pyralis]